MSDLNSLDDVRRAGGFLTVIEVLALIDTGNAVFDPYSLLISQGVRIGKGNIFFSCVTLVCGFEGTLVIGDGNLFYPNSLFEASLGAILIGRDNQFGEGGFAANANRPDAQITIGDNGRYMNGASIYGRCELGSGSQILGQITAENCRLEQGDSFMGDEPSRRAGLLKGSGNAKDLFVPIGGVIVGDGSFTNATMERQSFFNPEH